MVLMSYFSLPARAAGRGGEHEHGDWLSSWWTCFPRLSTLTLTHAMPSETDRGSLSKLSLIPHRPGSRGPSLLGLMKLVLFLKCSCLFWEWWEACVQYYVTVQVFIFYQKRREDFRFPINSLPFIRWSRGHPYGTKKRGLASRIRIELYSCPNYVSPVFSKQQWACLFYMYGCMDCYTCTLHAQYSVCTYTDYCIFCAHEIFTLDKVWVSLGGRAGIV